MPSKPLPPNTNPPFVADYAGAYVYPAWFNPNDRFDPRNNYYHPDGHGGIANRPAAIVLHTPEEEADDIEVTPAYFAGPARQASTHYYLDSDSDVFQCVPEYCAAIANGLQGMPRPEWALPGSLNWQTLSIEIEGRAHTIHLTMPVGGPQWLKLIHLVRDRAAFHRLPLTRERIIGHYQLSSERSDPGRLFPWDALIRDLNAPEITPHRRTRSMYIIGLENPQADAYLVVPSGLQQTPQEIEADGVIGGRTYLIPDHATVVDLQAMIYGPDPHEIRQATWDWLHTVVGFKRLA